MRQVGSGWALLAPLLVLAACGRVAGPPGAAAPAPASHSASRAHHPLSSTVTRQSVTRPGTTRQNSAGAVVALRMVSPESGWEVTRTQVLTTGDGGRHWVDVTPPSYIGGADAFFLDAAHAWILTNRNTLLRTADGGKTWTRGHPPANAMGGALAFSDARHGWLLVSRSMSMFQNAVDIYRTTDGGVSWTKVDSTGRDAAPGSLPFAGDKGGISFRDAVHGWVTLDVPETGPQVLYRTADGGKTWALQTLPNPPGIDLSQYQVGLPAPPTFFNPALGALALGIAGPGSATTTVVYTTSDGGSVWHPLSPLPAAPGLWNPTFVSRTVFWMVNRGTGALRRSVNGGKTWTAITPAAPPPGGLQNYAVTFASARVGFAWRFEQPGVWRTVDAGRRWTEARA